MQIDEVGLIRAILDDKDRVLGSIRSSPKKLVEASETALAVMRSKERQTYEDSFEEFIIRAWPEVDPAELVFNWHHRVIAEHLVAVMNMETKNLIVNIPPRPVAEDALVEIRGRGPVRLARIREGDLVLTHQRRWRVVEAVHVQGELDCLRLTTRAGRQLDLAPDHPVLTPKGWREAQWCTAGDIIDHEDWADILTSVEKIGKRPCRCLTVNEDGSFVANGIAVKNTGKTTIANILWPAFVWAQPVERWGPLCGPHVQFLCVSYGANLSEEIAVKMRRLVLGDWYQSLWGDRVKILPDQQSRANFGNTAGGARISASIEGGILGKGGDVQICFPFDEINHTAIGPVPIGEIVERRQRLDVWSLSADGAIELQPIIGWHRNPASALLRLAFNDGTELRCTPEHKLLSCKGWKTANELVAGDLIWTAGINQASFHQRNGLAADAVKRGESPVADLANSDLANLIASEFGVGMRRSFNESTGTNPSPRPLCANRSTIRLLDAATDVAPLSSSSADIPDVLYGNTKTSSQRTSRLGALQDFHNLCFGKYGGAVPLADREDPMDELVGDVLFPRPISKAGELRLQAAAVDMPNFAAWRCRSEERSCDQDVDLNREAAIIAPQFHAWIATNDRVRQQFTGDTSPDRAETRNTIHATEIGDLVPRKSRHGEPRLVRIVSVTDGGHADATYCLTVASNGTMVCGAGQAIVSNCDDPMTPKEANSAIERERVMRDITEGLRTRFNNPVTGARVLLMQRLHINDPTSHALEHWTPNVHLMFPMRFEAQFPCPYDLRAQLDDEQLAAIGRKSAEGMLLWPRQWPEEEVSELEIELGAFARACQLQQYPIPRGGGIIGPDDWKIWPEEEPRVEDLKEFPGGLVTLPLPEVSHVIAVLDTAQSEKDTADYNALIVFGVWHRKHHAVTYQRPIRMAQLMHMDDDFMDDDGEQARVIMMAAWRMRGKLNNHEKDRQGNPTGVVQRIMATIQRYRNIDRLVIEDKNRGIDVRNEIIRQFGEEAIRIELFNPKKHGDKVARLNAVQPLFEQGLVYAPANVRVQYDDTGAARVRVGEFDWCRNVMDEISQVPMGKFDDWADCLSMGLLTLRTEGFLALTKEYLAQQVRDRVWKGRKETVREMYGV